jgi:hypothetical protein
MNAITADVRSFAVLAARVPALLAAVAEARETAAARGLTYDLTCEVGPVRLVPEHRVCGGEHPLSGRLVRACDVTISGVAPRLPGGWTLVAVVDHRLAEPVVRAVPGVDVPAGVREHGRTCDHCQTQRRRAETFVVVADDGRVQHIGRSCLSDFLGHRSLTGDALLTYVTRDWSAEFGGGGGEGRDQYVLLTERVVLLAGASIALHGWVSRKTSQERGTAATSDHVADLLFARNEEAERLHAAIEPALTDALRAEVAAALAWARTSTEDSEYERNLSAIALTEAISHRELGLACSLLPAYRRATQPQVEREPRANDWLGTVGTKLTATLRLTQEPTAHQSQYGTTYRVVLADAAGNAVVWWASRVPAWVVADRDLTVVATVKGHALYRDRKQTVITRAKPA